MTIRLASVRERIAAAGLDALLVSDLTNIRWLTGFKGSNGWLVVSASSLVFVTDGRYGEQAQRQSTAVGVSLEVLVGATGAAVLDHTAQAVGRFARVGFEPTGYRCTPAGIRTWRVRTSSSAFVTRR